MAKRAKAESTGKKKRGRPSKKAVAQADVVEVRTGELDLQPVEIDDRDFDMHFAGVKEAKAKLESYQSKYRLALKSAKSVSPELHDAIKVALKFEKMGAEDVKRQLEIDGYVLKRQGSPVQMILHDTIMGDPLKVAWDRGMKAGEEGQDNANPYPPGSEFAARYDAGWAKGQGILIGGGTVPEDSNSGEPLPIQ